MTVCMTTTERAVRPVHVVLWEITLLLVLIQGAMIVALENLCQNTIVHSRYCNFRAFLFLSYIVPRLIYMIQYINVKKMKFMLNLSDLALNLMT